MRNFVRRVTPVFATLVFAALGLSAVVISTSAHAPAGVPEIGDAQVVLGEQAARVVERVLYREGVERVADVVLVDGSPIDLGDDPDVVATWKIVDRLWPDSIRSQLTQLSVVSEGPRGLVGVVHRASAQGWILSLDRDDLGDVSLVEETIAHEIAHVVTLGSDTFTFGTELSCNGVALTVGCAASDSLMARFTEEFWPNASPSGSQSAYVNEYAARAPHEDLAETFTAWVFDWPVGSSVVEAKIEMLSSDPQMASLAAELVERLG